MFSETNKNLIMGIMDKFEEFRDVDVSGEDNTYCIISFTTSFGGNSAYDLELSKTDEGYEAILLTSSETPLMRDDINEIDESEIESLLDHVVETLRELEGN
jgi:hypothetical protein